MTSPASYKLSQPSSFTMALLVAVGGLVAAGLTFFLWGDRFGLGAVASAWTGMGLTLLSGVALLVGMRRKSDGRSNSHDSSATPPAGDPFGLEDERNQRLIVQYHNMAKWQADSAHRSTQFAMLSGLLVLIAGSIVAISSQSSSVQVVVGTLTGLGSVISAYLSATFMSAYNRTLAQLNFFFGQPLVNSYLLTAERLSKSMGDRERDKVVEKL